MDNWLGEFARPHHPRFGSVLVTASALVVAVPQLERMHVFLVLYLQRTGTNMYLPSGWFEHNVCTAFTSEASRKHTWFEKISRAAILPATCWRRVCIVRFCSDAVILDHLRAMFPDHNPLLFVA